MTAAEIKAIGLVNKFTIMIFESGNTVSKPMIKQCASIAVDEIIKTLNRDIRDLDVRGNVLLDLISNWQQVKTEIEKL